MTPIELLTDPSVSSHAKALYGVLDVFSEASRETLAEMFGMSMPTISRAIAELRELGWIEQHRRGPCMTARYVTRRVRR